MPKTVSDMQKMKIIKPVLERMGSNRSSKSLSILCLVKTNIITIMASQRSPFNKLRIKKEYLLLTFLQNLIKSYGKLTQEDR